MIASGNRDAYGSRADFEARARREGYADATPIESMLRPHFIQSIRTYLLELPDLGHRSPIAVARFDVAAARTDDFQRYGVVCPSSIARSTPRRQTEFLTGRWLARITLGATDSAPFDLPVGISRAPLWPPGHTGSISHCPGLAAVTVLKDCPTAGLGIDVERIVDAGGASDLCPMIADEDELAILRRTRLPIEKAITIVFSAKESFFKATYARVQQFFDFNAVKVKSLNDQTGRLTMTVNVEFGEYLPMGRECRFSYRTLGRSAVLTGFGWRNDS